MATIDGRLELDVILRKLLGSEGVYFQPPANTKMKYPAIVYSRDDFDDSHANNSAYIQKTGYMVTLIDRDPDSEFLDAIRALPHCRFDRHYTADNLNHDVFTIYI